jgi:hypothetical protein
VADVREVGRDALEPLLFLLHSTDVEVQRATSAALGNLAVNSMFSIHQRLEKRSDVMKRRINSQLWQWVFSN